MHSKSAGIALQHLSTNMKTFNLIAASAIASSLLTACGGSSNSGNNPSQPQPPVITKYDRITPAAGDNYTFKVTLQSVDGSSPKVFYRTEEYSAFDQYGSQNKAININEPYLTRAWEYVKQDGSLTGQGKAYDLGYSTYQYFPLINPTNYSCSYLTPYTSSTPPYYVGHSWESSARTQCYINGKSLVGYDFVRTNKGSIVAQETVTVPAGSFTALKEVFTFSYNELSPNPGGGKVYMTSDRTCWRDVKTSTYVKCQITTTDPYYDIPPTTSVTDKPKISILEELTGYSIKNGGTLLVPQRFAGNWDVSFPDGKLFGSPVSDNNQLTIDTDGNISMAVGFSPWTNTLPAFQGKIDNAGNLKMTGSSYDGKAIYTVTGTASGTNSVSGTIVSSTGASQTWQMNR